MFDMLRTLAICIRYSRILILYIDYDVCFNFFYVCFRSIFNFNTIVLLVHIYFHF